MHEAHHASPARQQRPPAEPVAWVLWCALLCITCGVASYGRQMCLEVLTFDIQTILGRGLHREKEEAIVLKQKVLRRYGTTTPHQTKLLRLHVSFEVVSLLLETRLQISPEQQLHILESQFIFIERLIGHISRPTSPQIRQDVVMLRR